MSDEAYNLLKTLSEASEEHAKIVRRLGVLLKRLNKDVNNESIQLQVLRNIKRLRLIRSRIRRALSSAISLDSIDSESRNNIRTLSEYMLLVGFILEKDMLSTAIRVAKKGAKLLETHIGDLNKDLDELEEVVKGLEQVLESSGSSQSS